MAAEASPVVLAFDVGGTTIKAEALDADFGTVARASVPTPRGVAVVDALADAGCPVLGALTADLRDRVTGAGLAFPGIVDAGRGVSVYAANLGMPGGTPIVQPLSDRLGMPVWIGHDVNAAAEAERRLGVARELADPAIVVIGTGISAVAYVRGERVVGVSGQAGEVGHLVVRPGGPLCGCGARGCLEAVASASAVARAYSEATGGQVTGAREVADRLGRDPLADAVWDEATKALGDGLLAVVALLAPGAVVLGGGLAEAGPALLTPVAARMKEGARAFDVPPLLRAELGVRAGVVGAGLLAFDAVSGTRPVWGTQAVTGAEEERA